MRSRIAIFTLFILIVLLPSLTIFATGNYRWGYGVRDDNNYPVDFFPDNSPKQFIVNFSAMFRVNRNPLRENVMIYLPLPANNKLYQRVLSYKIEPEPTRIIESRYGYKIAAFSFGALSKEMAFGVKYHAEVEIYKVDIPLYKETVGTLDDIPEDIRRDYTKNGPFYRINKPYIIQAANQAVGDETNILMQARAIWLYVRKNIHYKGDGRKDTAVKVLKQGHGSCTEHSFAMIALCRAKGIPARYISGSLAKANAARIKTRDTMYHKIVEVYLPKIGWVPMESTAGGRYVTERTADGQIGKLRPRLLFFVHETERGLAPLDPRRNTVTWINKAMRSKVSLTGEVATMWERVKSRED